MNVCFGKKVKINKELVCFTREKMKLLEKFSSHDGKLYVCVVIINFMIVALMSVISIYKMFVVV